MPYDPESDPEWWRRAVIYQIYPRSFRDANGDGIGDLEGVISRLDYLNDGTENSLGIDAIWFSPTFPSPMKDFGYDVSDYCGVHPDFGDMAAMDRLIAECHKRGIRVLLDWVPNHSSDQHPWFIESRSSRTSAKRDWYFWRDFGEDGAAPNNWRSIFGGPAWQFDDATAQNYLHSFLIEQPDLNWRNPDVVAAMHDTLRFWMSRGVDGFRVDVLGMIVKHPDLLDNPPNPDWKHGDRDANRVLRTNCQNLPEVYDAVAEIRKVLDEYPGRMAVGEVFGRPDQLARYYGTASQPGLHLAFNFHFIGQDGEYAPWDADLMLKIVAGYEAALPAYAQPCYAFGNHDRIRFISRHHGDGMGHLRARAAALLLLGLRSTPFLYYGEEIGMEDVDVPEEQMQDPARFLWEGRDPERTPMQWDETTGRGFTTGHPWLPFGAAGLSVAAQSGDAASLLALYRRAIWTRKRTPALHSGSMGDYAAVDGVFSFVRESEGERIMVAVNTVPESRTLSVAGDVLVATGPRLGPVDEVELEPLGAAWVRLR